MYDLKFYNMLSFKGPGAQHDGRRTNNVEKGERGRRKQEDVTWKRRKEAEGSTRMSHEKGGKRQKEAGGCHMKREERSRRKQEDVT